MEKTSRFPKGQSITAQAAQNVHKSEREKLCDLWRKEADEHECMLSHIQEFIEGQTVGAIAGVKLDMRERILTELMELYSSLTFARIEALKEVKRLSEG